MSIVLVKCINYKELEDLTKSLLRTLKMMGAPVRYNRRKNEIVVDETKFRFVTMQQNIDGIRYDRVMNAYDFYKDGDKNGKNQSRLSEDHDYEKMVNNTIDYVKDCLEHLCTVDEIEILNKLGYNKDTEE